MNKTTIEWTDYTWNPVTGCTKVSQGCKNCYAETIANRFWGDRKFTDVQCHHDRLEEPTQNEKKWKGKKVFVCSMSDLFHESVPFDFIDRVFAQFVNLEETIFQVLTKRPDRAMEYFKYTEEFGNIGVYACEKDEGFTILQYEWPLENVWIGTSCEDQATANERIPLLLQIPAAVRFLSCEPLLGPIDIFKAVGSLQKYGRPYTLPPHPKGFNWPNQPKIDWVIAGGESGHGARPMHPDWVRSLRDQCQSANVPFFFKQWGTWLPDWQPEKLPWNGAEFFFDKICYHKVGKSKSGNILDGKQHLEFPKL